MITNDSFPYLIDTIFGDLEMISQFRIDCQAAEENTTKVTFAAIRVAAVNGMDSPRQFMNLLKHLKSEVMSRFREVVPQISPADLDCFIDMALRRVRRIIRSVVVNGVGTEDGILDQPTCWSVLQLQCYLDDVESDDPLCYLEAMVQTRRQAMIYYLELKRLEERIGLFAGNTIFLPGNNLAKQTAFPEKKFRLTCTVPFFSALLRIAYDLNLIEGSNVAELCRWASENFSTVRQDNLSPHSLRNHFDNPSSETLENLTREMETWQKYLAKFVQRQRQ
jgi:hypothetical protein